MMEIEGLSNPVWVDENKTAINCNVKVSGIPMILPFTACASDPEDHGRQLFADLVAGKYGDIAPFSADISEIKAVKMEKLTANYNEACDLPVQFTTGGGVTQTFQADTGSQQLLQTSISCLAGMKKTPPDFAWIALDNKPVPFAYNDLVGLAQIMYLRGYQAFVKLQGLKAQLRDAATEKEISEILW